MPRLSVLAVSARLPAWAETACAEYARRMPKGYEVARVAVKNDKALRAALPRHARVVALDERGKDCTTRQFADLLKSETAFVIGGPDGLDAAVKREAALVLRLSSLTLPHALAQVVLLEQIYRAASILTGHPYHRE
ncbi:MAG: 23S rRNA (pseudouridine(1915)-N(3))-methyltransferase RlmH [Betaproteobacteria bacterium]|nr:MAG: 23S rRNA (pseudouridine(1915)-N(3))-methyltransferase RlmH [Betaproteobacteria bacterium]